MRNDTLAIDFGTSNSAAAILHDGRPLRIAIEPGAETLPTAVF
ncbi:Hsp70 family protein, partial [Paracoccus sp. PXZ]